MSHLFRAKSNQELEEKLRNWTNFNEDPNYDFVV